MPPTLTADQSHKLIKVRRSLHKRPELSCEEIWTSQFIHGEIEKLGPDQLASGLGGTGVAAMFDSGLDGPCLLFRAELDGLPIREVSAFDYRSEIADQAHSCGHDGHMAILLGLGMRLAEKKPRKGRVVLLFQPAEETGKGAKAVLADPAFAPFKPDYAFALHNLPGLALGEVAVRSGPICCASRGIRIILEGKTSHASMPQDGTSPLDALMAIAQGLKDVSNGLHAEQELDESYKLVTITHMTAGEPCFGVSPGHGELWATLRTVTDDVMYDLVTKARQLALTEAGRHGLALQITEDDVFDAATNAQETTTMLSDALAAESIHAHLIGEPMRFSEDFGQFGHHCPSTLFLLGSGTNQPQLHNPEFDFPDKLIDLGVGIFERIARQKLG